MFKLKLKRLDWISSVDAPAQETATVLMLKDQRGALEVTARARVVKTSDELGLVFGWALTTKANGADYFDLHGDNIVEDDLIRVAAEFMEHTAATDQQHDFTKDGRVLFMMPLTAEVAKTFGVQTDTTGLMVAIKPSPEVFAKFKSGEYTGFSIAGVGERVEVKSARVQKGSLYTNEIDGHQHKVCVYEDGTLYVEWATMAGATQGHSHGVVFEGGKLTILADSGHTHELADGQPGLAIVPADAIVIVQARNSTQATAVPQPGLTTEEFMSTTPDLAKQIADLTKRNERLVKMSGAHKAHFDSLSGDDQEAFLAKSAAERDALIKAAADADPIEVEYNGHAYRKSAGSAIIELAKSAKAEATKRAERDEEIRKTSVRKRAEETLGGLTGSDEVHFLIADSLLKSGADPKLLDEAFTAMKGWRTVALTKGTAAGVGGQAEPEPANPQGEWDAEVEKIMKDEKVDRYAATDRFMKTAKGAQLYAVITKRVKGAK